MAARSPNASEVVVYLSIAGIGLVAGNGGNAAAELTGTPTPARGAGARQ